MALENEEDYLEKLLKSFTEKNDSSSTEDLFENELNMPVPDSTENVEAESLESILAGLDTFEDDIQISEKEEMVDKVYETLFPDEGDDLKEIFDEDNIENDIGLDDIESYAQPEEQDEEEEYAQPEEQDEEEEYAQPEEQDEEEEYARPEEQDEEEEYAQPEEEQDEEEEYVQLEEESVEVEEYAHLEEETQQEDALVDEYIQNLLNSEEETETFDNFDGIQEIEENTEEINTEENELINQLSDILNNIENDLTDDFEVDSDDNQEMMFDGFDNTDLGLEHQDELEIMDTDYSKLDMDDELKDIFGIENAEELKNIESVDSGELSNEDMQRLNEIETETEELMGFDNSQENTYDDEETEDNELDFGFAGLMDLVGENETVATVMEGVEGLEDIEDIDDISKELTSTKESDKDVSKKSVMSKLFSSFKSKNKNNKDNLPNENQQVLDTLFDENGELVEEDKKVKKKSLFSWMRKSDDKAKEAVVDEEPDEEDEPLFQKKEPDPEKIKKKEEKKAQKAQKKEENDKIKKEKQEQAKKKAQERKQKREEKRNEPIDASELVKIKPGVVIIMLLVTAGLTAGSYFFINIFTYNTSMNEALVYLNEHKYSFAYEAIVGIEPGSEEDKALIEQITTIMSVQKEYDSYERYIKMGRNDVALDTLIKSFAVYDENYAKAEAIGVVEELTEVKDFIVTTLTEKYGITEEMARGYAALEDLEQYEYIIQSYGGVSE